MAVAKIEEKEPRTRWAGIEGKWKFAKSSAHYLGPTGLSPSSPLGMARSSVRFRDGTIKAKIKLTGTTATSAGIFVRYQSPDSQYAVAAIGAFDRAYALMEFQPGFGWIARAQAGSLSNLNLEEVHEICVSVTGQSISLSVDDVDVLSSPFSAPLDGTGFGLYAYGESPVSFSDIEISSLQPKVFVIMPFSEPFDTLYQQVISPVSREMGFEVVRVDEVFGPGVIIDDIQRQIETSHAVVAEISSKNPNVFYELGYAHALRKPAIILVRRQDGPDMPFDIRSYRAIFYDDSIGGKDAVERNLRQHLHAILGA